MSDEQLLQGFIDGKVSGDIKCDVEAPEHPRRYYSNFPPIIKKTVVGKEDIFTSMRRYAEKEKIMAQPKKAYIKFIPN